MWGGGARDGKWVAKLEIKALPRGETRAVGDPPFNSVLLIT